MAFIYDLTDTWNAGGTTFNAIKMNVTDSASAAASKLITLQVGGVERFGVDKAGIGSFASVVRAAAGSTSAPAYGFTSNTNTGMWSPSSDAIAFSTAGSERLRVTSTGLVGIGTASPATRLAVSNGGANGFEFDPASSLLQTFNRATSLYTDIAIYSLNHRIFTGASPVERMRIDNSGNVGIGTSSPGARMVVAAANTAVASRGTAYLYSTNAMGANLGGQLSFGGSFTGTSETVFGSIAGRKENGTDSDISGYLQFSTTNASLGNVERMRIDSSGNVGIGSVPGVRFQITHDQAAYSYFDYYNTTNAGGVVWRQIVRNLANTGNTSVDFAKLISSGFAINNNDNNAANFTSFGIGGSERMRIDSSGNLLVGTTDSNPTSGTGVKFRPGQGSSVANVDSRSDGSSVGYSQYSTGAGAYRFYVAWNGQISATVTSISAISDQTLKENIRDLETGLSEVMALRPRRFDWKPETKIDEKNVAGFIAQEVEEVLPELVYDYQYNDGETKKSVKMGDILPTLVKAIQEQQVIINDLTARVAQLEGN